MTLEQMIARQQEIINAVKAANRDLTAEERKELNDLQGSIVSAIAERQLNGHGSNSTGTTPEEPGNPSSGQRGVDDPVLAERQRINEISNLCREFGMDSKKFIDNGSSIESVRSAVIEHMRKDHAPVPSRGVDSATVLVDEEDKYRNAASDGLMLRSGIKVHEQAAGARDFSHMTLRDLAMDCMMREGRSCSELIRMSQDDMYAELCRSFYNPTSAFPAIMDSTIRKTIVQLYNEVPTTFQEWTTSGSVHDFKPTPDHEYVIGGVGDFLIVPENGEIRADKPRTELSPNRKVDTYGKSFSMTRQAFINDDIGFLTSVPGLYAQAAKKTIDKQCYGVLFNNKALTFADKKTLFHADHKNLINAGSAPTQAAIQAMILQMQRQTDPFGEPIYMTPSKIIVPVGYEFDLAVIFGTSKVTGSANNDVNPLYNYPLTVVQSPVLNALAGENPCPWFMSASQSSARGIQVDYLNGQKTPTVRRMENPGILGFSWDIYLDWGISIRDYRGIVKNPGVKL